MGSSEESSGGRFGFPTLVFLFLLFSFCWVPTAFLSQVQNVDVGTLFTEYIGFFSLLYLLEINIFFCLRCLLVTSIIPCSGTVRDKFVFPGLYVAQSPPPSCPALPCPAPLPCCQLRPAEQINSGGGGGGVAEVRASPPPFSPFPWPRLPPPTTEVTIYKSGWFSLIARTRKFGFAVTVFV